VRSYLLITLILLFASFLPAVDAVPQPSLQLAVALAKLDASRLPEKVRLTCRYYYTEKQGKDLEEIRVAARYHFNLHSHVKEPVDVVEITPWLWRFDWADARRRGDLQILATLETAATLDHFFHEHTPTKVDVVVNTLWPGGVFAGDGKFYERGESPVRVRAGGIVHTSAAWPPLSDIKELRELLQSEVPILHFGWFMAQTSRQRPYGRAKQNGLGYYNLHGLKSRDDYFKLIKLNIKDSEDIDEHIRAALEKSGINPNDGARQIARFQALTGGSWGTFDTDDTSNGNNALDKPVVGTFKHNAEEWFSHLPNKTPVTLACNDKGVLQEFAPTDSHGFNDSSTLNASQDPRVHVNLACLRCHSADILQPIRDSFRESFKAGDWLGLSAYKDSVRRELTRQYLGKINPQIEADNAVYAEGIRQASITSAYPKGLTVTRAAALYARSFHNYVDTPVTLERAAAELGCAPVEFLDSLRFAASPPPGTVAIIDLPLSRFLTRKPLTIGRQTWEGRFAAANQALATWRLSRKR
jgi:hypothetical protein